MSKRKYSISNILLWLIYPAGFLSLLIFMFFTCSSNKNNEVTDDPQSDVPVKREFRMVMVPETIVSPKERATYLASHYWDNFNFSDTAYIHLPDITEQAFVDFLDILPHSDKATADNAIAAMLEKSISSDTTEKMYTYFLDLYKNYLHDPNSPLRDEEYYIPVTQYIIADSVSDEAAKSRADFNLKMMLKNRKGTKASDFEYLDISGKKGNLYSLNKEYTILYFYNPDCTACKETSHYLTTAPSINHLLSAGQLDILALYPDEDLTAWQKHKEEVPALWVNARDKKQKVKDGLLYDLKAIPTLYLLDRNKQVLLKDAPAMTVEAYLHEVEHTFISLECL